MSLQQQSQLSLLSEGIHYHDLKSFYRHGMQHVHLHHHLLVTAPTDPVLIFHMQVQADCTSCQAASLAKHCFTWVAMDSGCHLQVVCHTQPLVPSLWKTLLKLLNSNMFLGKASLIAAMARCDGDTWQPRGLVQGGLPALQPHLGLLIGQPHTAKTNR